MCQSACCLPGTSSCCSHRARIGKEKFIFSINIPCLKHLSSKIDSNPTCQIILSNLISLRTLIKISTAYPTGSQGKLEPIPAVFMQEAGTPWASHELQINTKLFWPITLILWWNISILMGVVVSARAIYRIQALMKWFDRNENYVNSMLWSP